MSSSTRIVRWPELTAVHRQNLECEIPMTRLTRFTQAKIMLHSQIVHAQNSHQDGHNDATNNQAKSQN